MPRNWRNTPSPLVGNARRNRTSISNTARRNTNVISKRSMDEFIGENAVFHLKLKHGFSNFSSDASGLMSVSGYFSPDSLPGWAALGTLFKYFRVSKAMMLLQPLRGTDENGTISIRVSSDPNDAIEATIAEEVERGAKTYPVSLIPKNGILVDLLSVSPAEDSTVNEWKSWHATTPFGDAKEFGQIFIRGNELPVSVNIVSVLTKTEISFKSLLNI